MEIKEVIILPEVERKLVEKHDVFGDEVEEVFQQQPLIRFARKAKSRVRIFM